MKRILSLSLLLLALGVTACSEEETPTTPTPTVSFQRDVRAIFNAKCIECHQPAGAGGILNLKSDSVWLNLMSKRSPNSKTWFYVLYKNRQESLLYRKVKDLRPPFGLAMPVGDTLSTAELETIGVWIDEGAMNN